MINREQVRKAFQLIRRRSDFEFFFDNLKSIDWLDPLLEEGAFTKPDAPVKHENNSVSFPFWPPAKYLARVASQDPPKVLKTIQKVPPTENPRIHEDFLDAALAMPADVSVQLKGSVISWIVNPYQMLLPRKVAQYIALLMKGGFKTEAESIASALFDVRRDENRYGERVHFVVRNDWEFGECLKIVAPTFTGPDLKVLILTLTGKLEKAVLLDGHLDEEKFQDHSYIWRGSIEDSNQNHDYNVKDTLVNWIRDLSEQFLKEDPNGAIELCREFAENKLPIIVRLALHLARRTSDEKLIREFVLDIELFESDDVWHEYALLIHEKYNVLKDRDRDALIQLIETYQPYDKVPRIDEDKLVLAIERKRYKYYYMIKSHLTGNLLKRFEEMHKKFGDLDHPTFSSYSMVWSGPNSPKSTAELDQFSLKELADYLRNWRPPPARHLGPEPSIEGLAMELESLVKQKPTFFASAIEDFKLPEKTYVRAIIQGFTKSLAEGLVEWGALADYLIWACTQKDVASAEDCGSDEDEERDPRWSWTKATVSRLIEGGLTSKDREIPFSLRQEVWKMLESGLQDSDPDPGREEKYTSDKNFYQTAINSTRGIALETALHYGFWAKRNIEREGRKFSAHDAPELFSALDRHLNLTTDPSRAVRAVYGRWIPYLVTLDLEWLRDRIEIIFPKDRKLSDYWWAAWRAYMLFSRPYSNVFSLMTNQYDRALDELISDPKESLENVDTRLAHHLITFYVIGKVELNSALMQKFYEKADLRLRANAIEFLGRSLAREKKDFSTDFAERARALWLHRVAACKALPNARDRQELAEFGWWMGTKHFTEEWILDQTIEALKLCHQLTPDHLVLGRLIGLAEEYPVKVAQVLKLIVEHKVSDYGFYGWIDKGQVLLRKLMKTAAKKDVEDIIHHLGAYGFRDIGSLLKERG